MDTLSLSLYCISKRILYCKIVYQLKYTLILLCTFSGFSQSGGIEYDSESYYEFVRDIVCPNPVEFLNNTTANRDTFKDFCKKLQQFNVLDDHDIQDINGGRMSGVSKKERLRKLMEKGAAKRKMATIMTEMEAGQSALCPVKLALDACYNRWLQSSVIASAPPPAGYIPLQPPLTTDPTPPLPQYHPSEHYPSQSYQQQTGYYISDQDQGVSGSAQYPPPTHMTPQPPFYAPPVKEPFPRTGQQTAAISTTVVNHQIPNPPQQMDAFSTAITGMRDEQIAMQQHEKDQQQTAIQALNQKGVHWDLESLQQQFQQEATQFFNFLGEEGTNWFLISTALLGIDEPSCVHPVIFQIWSTEDHSCRVSYLTQYLNAEVDRSSRLLIKLFDITSTDTSPNWSELQSLQQSLVASTGVQMADISRIAGESLRTKPEYSSWDQSVGNFLYNQRNDLALRISQGKVLCTKMGYQGVEGWSNLSDAISEIHFTNKSQVAVRNKKLCHMVMLIADSKPRITMPQAQDGIADAFFAKMLDRGTDALHETVLRKQLTEAVAKHGTDANKICFLLQTRGKINTALCESADLAGSLSHLHISTSSEATHRPSDSGSSGHQSTSSKKSSPAPLQSQSQSQNKVTHTAVVYDWVNISPVTLLNVAVDIAPQWQNISRYLGFNTGEEQGFRSAGLQAAPARQLSESAYLMLKECHERYPNEFGHRLATAMTQAKMSSTKHKYF